MGNITNSRSVEEFLRFQLIMVTFGNPYKHMHVPIIEVDTEECNVRLRKKQKLNVNYYLSNVNKELPFPSQVPVRNSSG